VLKEPETNLGTLNLQTSASLDGWRVDMEERISETPTTRAVHRWLGDKADLTSMTEWLARKADIDEVQAHITMRANRQFQELAIPQQMSYPMPSTSQQQHDHRVWHWFQIPVHRNNPIHVFHGWVSCTFCYATS